MKRFVSALLGVSWAWLIASGQAVGVVSQSEGPKQGGRLPTPVGLERDVRFWELAFSRYTPAHCLFHDKDDLRIVYAAKKIPGDSPRQQVRQIQRYMGAIRLSLGHLADGGTPRNLLEQRIVRLMPREAQTPSGYREAAGNIRCQRGIDLTPSLERSSRYLGMVQRSLAARKLPTDLAYLPFLESGYNERAHSKAGARGLWQLMPATARLLGLKVNRWSDQRLDTHRATTAALGLLQSYYQKTGSWPLAITAYNYGPNGMARAIERFGPDYMVIREKHRTRIFGFAAKNYYPSFLAVRNVVSRLDHPAGKLTGETPVAMERRKDRSGSAM